MHWAQSQATYIRNVTIDVGDGDTGIFGENGSGGFIGDITVIGGNTGLEFGNQQWTFRGLTVVASRVQCLNLFWNWAFAFVGLNLTGCPVGIQFTGGAAGSLMLLDSSATNVDTVVTTDFPASVPGILIERLALNNVTTVTTGLPGVPNGSGRVVAWRQGPQFVAGALQPGNQGTITLTRPDAPMAARARPTFGAANGTTGVANVYDYGEQGAVPHVAGAAVHIARKATSSTDVLSGGCRREG